MINFFIFWGVKEEQKKWDMDFANFNYVQVVTRKLHVSNICFIFELFFLQLNEFTKSPRLNLI
jgi:hypothetical protein